MEIERIYIKELTERFRCKDIRTVIKWCESNNVGILTDTGSIRKYIMRTDFEKKYNSEPIKYITEKYGKDKLPVFLNSQIKFFAEYKQVIDEKTKKYNPQGKHELEFLVNIAKYLNPTV